MSADTFCPRCFFGPLPDGVPERIRELEAEAAQWQESSGQNYVRAQDAEMREEKLERERDRLRAAIERAPCGWADSDPVGTLYGAICDNCDCWKRSALNTESSDET